MHFFFQDVLAQTSASFDELLTPSCRKASEHTAAAALTELRNNSTVHHIHHHQHNQKQQQHPHHQQQQQHHGQSALVTSILSKNHINHLEANSVSVIPIENTKTTTSPTSSSITSSNVSNHQNPNGNAPILQMRSLSQLQQHLETAAVLMDISKKVIISPPSSNPQSPSVLEQQQQTQSITSTVINMKRSKSSEEMDLSTTKRQRPDKRSPPASTVSPPTANRKPSGLSTSTPITSSSTDHIRKPFNSVADLTVIKRCIVDESAATAADELSQQSDNSNDGSDPGRLQIDINSQEAIDAEDSKSKLAVSFNKHFVDSGRETPDSMKSEDQGTDPATTQLWQALARTTGKKIISIYR